MSPERNTDTAFTRRQVLGGLITAGASSAAAGAGTAASFSDTEASTGNSITAGTLDLGFDDSSSLNLAEEVASGQTIAGSVTIVSEGTLSGTLDIGFNVSDTSVAEKFAVVDLTYGTNKILNEGDQKTLADLASAPNYLTGLGDPEDGTEFSVALELDNGVKSEEITVSVTFQLKQNGSQ